MVNVVGKQDLLAAGRHVPGASSVRRLVVAAGERGVRRKVLDNVLEASAKFEALVARHAEDRTSFDAMLQSLVRVEEEGGGAVGLTLRRNAYRLNSSIWGL